jgi:hypothetical protein
MPWSQVNERSSAAGSSAILPATGSETVTMSRPSSCRSTVNREVRSRRVAIGVTPAEHEVAFPVTGHGPVFNLHGPVVNRHGTGDLAADLSLDAVALVLANGPVRA